MKEYKGTHKVVITGPPGSGKTSLLGHLQAIGYPFVPEGARLLIKESLNANSNLLPWIQLDAFHEVLAKRLASDFDQAQEGLVFFDRGLVDIVSYCMVNKHEIPASLRKACTEKRYFRKVFICPAWEEIYAKDDERKEDFSMAKKLDKALREAYTLFNYELIELPKTDIASRAAFILKELNEHA